MKIVLFLLKNEYYKIYWLQHFSIIRTEKVNNDSQVFTAIHITVRPLLSTFFLIPDLSYCYTTISLSSFMYISHDVIV